MTLITTRLEALVVARIHTSTRPLAVREVVQPLVRFAPPTLTEAAWREQLAKIVGDLRARDVIGADHLLRDPDQLAKLIGRHSVKTWRQLADRVLPALGLGMAPDDKSLVRLTGRDEWAAAIVGRVLGLWIDGPPMSLAAVCDSYAWRELGLPGKPKRCPPEVRALFVQRALASDAGPPDRLVRLLAAREVEAPRADLKLLRDALVRSWLSGRTLGRARPFAAEVREVAATAHDGVFGDRKVFIASVWNELRRSPPWSSLTLDEFKARLIVAHRAGDVSLARADLVAAMDPELVVASETTTDGASFHFIVREASS
jgi:hypothetical protein